VTAMCRAERVVDVDVAEFRQRRAERIHVFLIRFDLQPVHVRPITSRSETARCSALSPTNYFNGSRRAIGPVCVSVRVSG